MKKKHKISLIIGIILLIILAVGGKIYMDKKTFNDEMLEIVNSKEASKVYEETIKNNDPKAFTENGVIQSYKIDYNSIEHNPMGGIMLDLIVNDSPNLLIDVILDKDNDGTLRNSAGGTSSDLDDLLTKEETSNE
jgi:hypothetical protein